MGNQIYTDQNKRRHSMENTKLHLQRNGMQIVRALALNPNADISKLDLSRPGSCFSHRAPASPRKHSRASSVRSNVSSTCKSVRSGQHSTHTSTSNLGFENDNFEFAAKEMTSASFSKLIREPEENKLEVVDAEEVKAKETQPFQIKHIKTSRLEDYDLQVVHLADEEAEETNRR